MIRITNTSLGCELRNTHGNLSNLFFVAICEGVGLVASLDMNGCFLVCGGDVDSLLHEGLQTSIEHVDRTLSKFQ